MTLEQVQQRLGQKPNWKREIRQQRKALKELVATNEGRKTGKGIKGEEKTFLKKERRCSHVDTSNAVERKMKLWVISLGR